MATKAVRRKPPVQRTSQRGGLRSRGAGRARQTLSDRQRTELIGLGLLAFGVLLGIMRFAAGAGGALGGHLLDASRLVAGRASIIVPVAIGGLGLAMLASTPMITTHPFRLGAGLLGVGAFTGLGAGVLGLAPAATAPWFDGHAMMIRGGLPGAALGWVSTSLLGRVGSAVFVVLALTAGALLISGASASALMRSSSSRAAAGGRAVARGVALTTSVVVREGRRIGARVQEYREATPPRSNDVTPAPLMDGADRFPEVYAAPWVDESDERLRGAPEFAADGADSEPLVLVDLVDELPSSVPPIVSDASSQSATPSRNATGRPMRRPKASLLRRSGAQADQSPQLVADTSRRLEETLGHFGVQASVVGTVSGPRVTRYELQLAPGTKVSRVSALRDDLAYALAARDELRILAPIPGKQAVGVEVPNPSANLVTLGDIYRELPMDAGPLMAWLGLDLGGKPVHIDLAKMPHLLIAGSTGTGKSVCLNALLASLLIRSGPERLRMVLIDPKKVELNHYDHIPHLLTPVVTNMKMATAVLANLVGEMESRYSLMGAAKARNLHDWNLVREQRGEAPLPAILILIDELADLMMVSPAEVEDAIIRLAQKSRAVGIHLVLATQRPSVDVITGMIKANVPSRIAFAVSSQVDSRVVLDANGAESLLGHGDMLFRPVGSSRLQRLQGAYVSEEEILEITNHWRAQGRPEIRGELLTRPETKDNPLDAEADEMLIKAIDLVVAQGMASVSLLQRRLGVGYARAGRLVDVMEQLGVVSGHEGSKPRSVLIGPAEAARFRSRFDGSEDEQQSLPLDEATPEVEPVDVA